MNILRFLFDAAFLSRFNASRMPPAARKPPRYAKPHQGRGEILRRRKQISAGVLQAS